MISTLRVESLYSIYRRFASSTGMYKDEQERRQTYTKVMEFEQDRVSV